jgi:hypothetical protein
MRRRHQNYSRGGVFGGWGAYPGYYTYPNNIGNFGYSDDHGMGQENASHEASETPAQEATEDATAGGGSLSAGMGDVMGGSPTSGDSVGTSAAVGTAQSA